MEVQVVPLRSQPVSAVLTDEEAASGSLQDFLSVIGRQKWKIAAFVSLSAVVIAVCAMRMKPLYESTAKLEVDHPGGNGVVGPEAAPNTNPVNDMDQILTTHLEAIKSAAVLRPVVDRFHLLEEEGQLKGKSAQQIDALRRGAVTLERLQIKRPPNSYMIDVTYRAHNPKLAADVANAIAQDYVERSADLQSQAASDHAAVMEQQIVELKKKMQASEAALAAFENQLGILDPDQRTSLLTVRLNQLSTELAAAQDERSRREAAAREVQAKTIAAAQSTTQGDNLARVLERLNEARQKFAEVKIVYGPNHPEYRKAESEVQELTNQLAEGRSIAEQRVTASYDQSLLHERTLSKMVAEAKGEIDRLTGVRHRYEQLKRDAEGDKQLYSEMTRRIKEYQINGAFRNSVVRLVDPALAAPKPATPSRSIVIALGTLGSLVLAMLVAVVMDALDHSLVDPEQASRLLKFQVLAALPDVKKQAVQALAAPNDAAAKASLMRSMADYGEAIRTLRNTVDLLGTDEKHKCIAFTSAVAGEGKSTTVAHLAITYAAQGKRVLVIDADLRRPSLHERFHIGYQPDVGLASVLKRDCSFREAMLPVGPGGAVSLLPAGAVSGQNPADLVGTRISAVIGQACREFDVVLVDAPPMLGVAETAQIGVAAHAVVIVTRAGRTSGKLVTQAIWNLQRFGANVLGVILNRVSHSASGYGYGYGYGQPQRAEAPRALIDERA